jgi:hypothetical protein
MVKVRAGTIEINGRDRVEPICRCRQHCYFVDVKATEAWLVVKARKSAQA